MSGYDFDVFSYANAVHSWKVYSSTTYEGPYTTPVSSTPTGSGPIVLANNLQSNLYYGIKHEVITACSTVCEDGVLFYNTNLFNKLIHNSERSSLCCSTFDDLVTLTAPTDNVLAGTVENYDTYYHIVASNIIENNANATYKANESIILKAGFHAKYNSIFHAYILPCDYITNTTVKSVNETTKKEISDEDLIRETVDFIQVYPNPTKGILKIESSKEVSNWIIMNVYGKSLYRGHESKTIDMSNIAKGVYFLKAILHDGKVVTKKIIKN